MMLFAPLASALSFGNPLGFLALLGIPAVLAIHFLQRRSRQAVVSTLFLLQQLQRESEGGSRFERLRPSIPLSPQVSCPLAQHILSTCAAHLRSTLAQHLRISTVSVTPGTSGKTRA